MNEISKARISLARKNFIQFKSPDLAAAIITGSVAKGYADEFSDIDTILMYDKNLSHSEFERIVSEAKASGGDLYYGSAENGFAVYYYIEGIKCDFGFGKFEETVKLFEDMASNPEVDLIKHLQIVGIIDGVILYGEDRLNLLITKAQQMSPELKEMLVKHHLKFHPKWALEKMGAEREDVLFYYESLLEIIGNIIGILCGLNGMYHPGKLKGAEFTIEKMKIKPNYFVNRHKEIFELRQNEAVEELYKLINETIELVEVNMPQVSTERTKEIQKMVLRK